MIKRLIFSLAMLAVSISLVHCQRIELPVTSGGSVGYQFDSIKVGGGTTVKKIFQLTLPMGDNNGSGSPVLNGLWFDTTYVVPGILSTDNIIGPNDSVAVEGAGMPQWTIVAAANRVRVVLIAFGDDVIYLPGTSLHFTVIRF